MFSRNYRRTNAAAREFPIYPLGVSPQAAGCVGATVREAEVSGATGDARRPLLCCGDRWITRA